ncbi:MAG TPA: hypothetical protein VIL05_08665 [Thermoclostridium sp.]
MKLSVEIEKKLPQFTLDIRMEIDQENISILGVSGSGKSIDKNYLMVTHDMDEAYRLSEKILVMENGKMLAFDTRERLFDHPPNLATARILGLRNVSEAKRVKENMIMVPQWGCFLKCGGKQRVSHVGIRSQHVLISPSPGINGFGCEIVRILEDRFTTTLFFRLLPARNKELLLQAIVDKTRW